MMSSGITVISHLLQYEEIFPDLHLPDPVVALRREEGSVFEGLQGPFFEIQATAILCSANQLVQRVRRAWIIRSLHYHWHIHIGKRKKQALKAKKRKTNK